MSEPPVQDFMSPIDDVAVSNPDGLNRNTGLLVVLETATDAAKLVVNTDEGYGTNKARGTTLKIPLDPPDSHTVIVDASSTRSVAFE